MPFVVNPAGEIWFVADDPESTEFGSGESDQPKPDESQR